MAIVRVRELTKLFQGKPPTKAVDCMNLEIDEGEFVVLLGPSGCGKTTTLRSIAGLETPDQGEIRFDERTVFSAKDQIDVPPNRRDIGMVFQSYALWPHMTVHNNIRYPLKARRVSRETWSERITEVARLVDCEELLNRRPGQLSGGQAQRVALARALVARPGLVLFDEPLSNLDARLRDLVREQIHELHRNLKFTAVFVTHDQREALALGDRLAIMNSGRIEQVGTASQVYESPETEYVAGFIGISNRFTVSLRDGNWVHEDIEVQGEVRLLPAGHRELVLRLRPEDVTVTARGSASSRESLTLGGVVADAQYGGRYVDVAISIGTGRVQARVPAGNVNSWARSLTADQAVDVSFRAADALVFDLDGAAVQSAVAPQLLAVTK